MKKLVLFGMAAIAFASCSNNETFTGVEEEKHHWDYENPDWQNHGYPECAGFVQSPIDIVTKNTVKTSLPEIGFNHEAFPIKVVDNGHTVQINASKGGITYNGETYALRQFHFHADSEHTIDGAKKPMEVHFVHQHPTNNTLVVLGVMVRGGGAENAEFAKYLKAFPTQKNAEQTLTETINPTAMFPTSKKYYNYTGSLTTPPCSQGLNWVVFKDELTVSDAQIEAFKKAYSHNARPVQPVGSRTVFESQ